MNDLVRMLIEGYILGLAVSIPVGPVTIGLVRRSLLIGFWNAVSFGSGSVSADLFYISLVYFGVAPLLTEHVWLRVVLWTGGAVWLAWLGIGAIRSAWQPEELVEGDNGGGNLQGYIAGAGITLLNPLTIIGWLTLGGGYFALYTEAYTLSGGLLALLAIIAGLMSHVIILSGVLSAGRRWLRPGVVRGVSAAAGGILLLIALNFLVSAIQGILGEVMA